MASEWSGKRVTVMGLGRFGGGVGVTCWLAQQGAHVVVTDLAQPTELQASLAQIADLDVTLRLGEHRREDFTDVDAVIANPAVKPSSEFLQAAYDAGVLVTTEINLFVERCPATCVGVTGSVGKSTIAAMAEHVLTRALPERRTWLGGNIGKSLLDALPEMTADDIVVLELSSFQLHYTPAARWSPHVAVIANVTPNHLDWHGTFAAYLADKLTIVRYQDPERDVIVIEDAPDLRRNFDLMFGDVAGLWRYSTDGDDLTARMQSTSAIESDDRQLRWNDVTLAVPGEHNRRNAAAALTVAAALGAPQDAAVKAIASFEGLPHRLRRVATVAGATYYDDSKSTTPEAVVTALRAMTTPTLIILGGYDKKSDLTPAIDAVAAKAKFAACIGVTGPVFERELRARGVEATLFDTLEEAVRACRDRAADGDAVLLSPGCASWGMFQDYRQRGEVFAQCVREFANETVG